MKRCRRIPEAELDLAFKCEITSSESARHMQMGNHAAATSVEATGREACEKAVAAAGL